MPSEPIINSVWTRPDRPRRGTPSLSREQIVTAAVELLDADGIDGLSMRRLGSKLGAGTTSVYWYVASKDDLLDLALDEIMGEIDVPDPDEVGWRAAAGTMTRGVRSMILRHPWITSLFGARPNIGPNSMRLTDRVIGLLTGAGFAGMEAGYAGSLLTSFAIGSATTEAAYHAAMTRSGTTGEDMIAALDEYQRGHAADYPNYQRWWRENQPIDIPEIQEEIFAFGVERMLDGLAAWLDRPR